MTDYGWSFRKMDKSEINIDPIQGEFFSAEEVGSLSDALVRESIQNSLDAKSSGSNRVTVRFHLSQSEPGASENFKYNYLGNLHEHLHAPDSGLKEIPNLDGNFQYLLIEDFGTSGLMGDTEQYDDCEGDSPNHFYYFWRNVGRSGKSDGDLGRWGLGKNVFPASSLINCFFGYTIREDSSKLFMGQSVLKTHRIDGVKHYPYGYFSKLDSQGFSLPIENSELIDEVTDKFNMSRENGKSGLSILIPFPNDEITFNNLLSSVVEHYFYPICSGELVVLLDESDSVELNQVTIKEYIQNDKQRKAIDFTFWILAKEKPDVTIKIKDAKPEWQKEVVEKDSLEFIKEKLDSLQKLWIRVFLPVPSSEGELIDSFYDVYLSPDDSGKSNKTLFIREGITIKEVSSPKERGIYSIILVKDNPLATLLGDSENPAHTKWLERTKKFEQKYGKAGKFYLRFIKKTVTGIMNLVREIEGDTDISTFAETFYLPEELDKTKRRKRNKKKGKDGGDKFKSVKTNKRAFVITQLPGGFKITRDSLEAEMNDIINVKAAYRVRRGNPFKSYRKFDFDLGKKPILVAAHSADVVSAIENNIKFKINDDDFEIHVHGFDSNRDLIVRAEMQEV